MTRFPPEPALRAWQAEALGRFAAAGARDFLVTATPGAGKTTFALEAARRMLAGRAVDRVVVVVPTDHLRSQWAAAAAAAGLRIAPAVRNDAVAGADGYVATYAQIAARPVLHRRRVESTRSLVILDEIHHAGDALSWGEAIREAFTPATRRLALTGTPFRTRPDERIPFVRYDDADDDQVQSVADYGYGYRQALGDGVVRPVMFAAYSGVSRWMDSAGQVLSAGLSDALARKDEAAAWRTALSPTGKWIPHVVASADARLSDVRASGVPDAAALMLASDQDAARAYAAIIERVTGQRATVVVSDDPQSPRKIDAFARGTGRWLVAVRQVSEGVDIPRLAVLAYCTSYRTPLFFAQAVGRVIRARAAHETATVFLPAVRPLLALAADMENERNAVARAVPAVPREAGERAGGEPGVPAMTALGAEAEFAHLLASGRAVTADLADADQEYLGLPGLLTPEQTAALLAARDADLRRRAASSSGGEPAPVESWRQVGDLRREVHGLVGRVAARTGTPHADVHVQVRSAVPGPATREAGVAVLEGRRDWLLARLH